MENQKSGSISTQLNISNNDIVTMLLEERKEQLRVEIALIKDQIKVLVKPYKQDIYDKLSEFYNSEEFLSFKEQAYNFAKIYNPNVDIQITGGGDDISEEVDSRFHNYYRIHNVYVSPRNLSITSVNEKDEDVVRDFTSGDDIYYPEHLEKSFKVNMSDEDYSMYNELFNKVESYENESRNSHTMRDKLVAKMTKAAIMNNPELIAIRDSVLKLE